MRKKQLNFWYWFFLPYYLVGKTLCRRDSFGYNLFLFLNLLWICLIIILTLIGIITCLI